MRMLGDHPNIAAIHAMWVPGATMRTAAKPDSKDGKLEEPRVHDELYLVMDLFDTDLSQILKSTHPLTAEHHRFMMFQLMRGLEHIHANGIIHRDVKPANLLVTRDCNLCITGTLGGRGEGV